MRDLILLKIGGSICTEKHSGRFIVRARVVRRLAKEISDARSQKPFRLVVVNGAGPFGHANVVEYDIRDGVKTARDFEGFVKTVSDCAFVNHAVSELLRKGGLLTFPYPASSAVIQSRKKIASFSLDPIKRLWDASEDIVPVIGGTMVPDLETRGSIISGDTVIEYLAERLSPRLVVFATDVDGIFSDDPHRNRKARLFKEVTKASFARIRQGLKGSASTDVTGGMLGKVEKLLSLQAPSLIINGNRPGRVRDALLGNKVKGTLIG